LTAAASAAAATKSPAAATKVPTCGLNDLEWSKVSAALGGGVPGKRLSQFGTDGVPGRWPRLPESVRLGVVSFNPKISELLDGKLDGKLEAYARTIPDGQAVTVWHEMERRDFGYSPQTIKDTMAHARAVIKRVQPKCRFVQIVTAYSFKSRGSNVFGQCISPVVDAVYMDAYGHSPSATIEGIAGSAAGVIRNAAGKGMPLGLAETNYNNPGGSNAVYRARWLKDAWQFAQQNDYEIFFSFWGDGYNWDPHDTATVNVLRSIMSGQRT
jgi:hypothetical protein